ncbi:anti-sigma factor antagonist [Waterburya agarophytonicola K14]|uniref:Anti-sigma factor antagonist n=1 Tax=Waterburya agarophytonicola KI4 TaxID=2874699 RepID=A0A964BTN6_9CYAN|nr:anti-sigma factor antagonist [Waterburya agarophytonicola]MCC0177650.1 anti-sigma factor antagonist [Waterburya agarophytonicola KI4]
MRNTISDQDFPTTNVNNNSIIQVPSRLTILESIAFGSFCCELIDNTHTDSKLILNLSNTSFIDSSGVGALVRIYKVASKHNHQLVLQKPRPSVVRVLEISGLIDIFQIQPIAVPADIKQVLSHPSVNSELKRLIDVMGAIVGLAISAIIFIPIVIAIKIDSPGPIFFSQTRCGWLGGKFRMWKFRSMCTNAETMRAKIPNQAQGAFFKNDSDPRVTRVGKFLRRTSLDELPQFWNVLKGEMSLVGTRPPTPEEMDQYQILAWQRLNVKPGMTGEWQVNGRSQVRDFEDVVQLDLNYQKNWSLSYDIKIILKTIMVVFNKNSGAV